MKTKLYLDTSVSSAFFDTSKPMRQLITQKWLENEAVSYELYISPLTIQEIERLRNPENSLTSEPARQLRKIHEINLKSGYQIVEIGSLELFGGAIYGNL